MELEALCPVGGEGGPAADISNVGAVKNGIYSYRSLATDLALLQKAMPARFSCSSLGQTADGREIYCVVLGSGFGSRQIVVDVAIHGSEHMNPPAVMQVISYYLQNYDQPIFKGRTVREILDDTDIVLLPMMNPDGVTISQFGLSGLNDPAVADQVQGIYEKHYKAGDTGLSLTSYLRVWKANANGVDLNRNYLFSDQSLKVSSSVKSPANKNYAGDPKNPEAETAAYVGLVGSLSHPVASLSIHSQGELIYWSCRQAAADKTAAKRLAKAVGDVTGYWLDDSDSFAGASADWMMLEKHIPSVTVECGKGGTPLSATQVPKIYTALKNVFLAAASLYE